MKSTTIQEHHHAQQARVCHAQKHWGGGDPVPGREGEEEEGGEGREIMATESLLGYPMHSVNNVTAKPPEQLCPDDVNVLVSAERFQQDGNTNTADCLMRHFLSEGLRHRWLQARKQPNWLPIATSRTKTATSYMRRQGNRLAGLSRWRARK